MLSFNQISLIPRSRFTALRTTFDELWLDDGSGSIPNPWDDDEFWGVVSERFFADLQSSLSQHYTLALTFAEDETLSIDFATTSTGNEEALLGDNPSAHALLIRTDGKIELVGSATVVFNSVVTDGLLNTFKIVRTGTGVEGFLNGVSDGTGTISGDITFTRIAGQNGNFFNGIIANLTKDLTHNLALDEDFGTTSIGVNTGSIGASGNATAVNITSSDEFTKVGNDWEGVELWSSTPDTIGIGWVDNGGGSYTHTGANSEIQTHDVLTDGDLYVLDLDLSGAGLLTAKLGGPEISNNTVTDLSAGHHRLELTAENVSISNAIRFNTQNTTEITIFNISVKRIIKKA